MADPVDDSTLRRLVRFSDAARDATQNARTFGLTPEEVELLKKLVERLDHQITMARNV
jgi:hypothetical protein